MSHLVTIQGATEAARDVARAVIGHHSLDASDSVCGEEPPRSLEEIYGRNASLIGEHLGVGQSRSIVDSNVDEP
jgi:hypothetical protein